MNEPRIAPESVHNAPTSTIGDYSPQASATIHDRTGLYLSIIALILSALALGITIVIPKLVEAEIRNLRDRAVTAERESRVMQERWNDLKVELAKRGIPVSDH